jgi:hypothetical protein
VSMCECMRVQVCVCRLMFVYVSLHACIPTHAVSSVKYLVCLHACIPTHAVSSVYSTRLHAVSSV